MVRNDNTVAVALDYDGEAVPVISAIGRRKLATTIAGVARRYGVPVKTDDALANELSRVETDSEVPSELYEAVAELFYEIDSYS